jgi:hypothetical protein
MIPGPRDPVEDTPLFELDDPNLFPIEGELPEGVELEVREYDKRLDRLVDTRNISYDMARKILGRRPDLPIGAALCRAVLAGEVDYRLL